MIDWGDYTDLLKDLVMVRMCPYTKGKFGYRVTYWERPREKKGKDQSNDSTIQGIAKIEQYQQLGEQNGEDSISQLSEGTSFLCGPLACR